MSCRRCGQQYGILIEEGSSYLCLDCHPTALSNLQSPEQNLKKMENIDFHNVRNRKYKE